MFVISSLNIGKLRQAALIRDSIPQGSIVGNRRADQLAARLEKLLFDSGGLATIQAVLGKFMVRPLVKRVMPQTDNTTDTNSQMIAAVRHFLKHTLSTKGRRNNMDTNVYWAVLVAVLPEQLVENRLQSQLAQELGVKPSTIQKALAMKQSLTIGWNKIENSEHCDRVYWEVVSEWIHSDEGSTIDNDHKQMIQVTVTNKETGETEKDAHPRRRPNGTKRDLYETFKSSGTYLALQARCLQIEKEKRLAKATTSVNHIIRTVISFKIHQVYPWFTYCSCFPLPLQ